MIDCTKKLIRRQELLEAVETYDRNRDGSLLPGIFQQIEGYAGQRSGRRQQLKAVFSQTCSLEQALDLLDMVSSAAEYYLMGCYLLAGSRQNHWDISEIIAGMQSHCSGCISCLCDEYKDFIGRIALKKASEHLTKEQLIRVIRLLDGYYLRQDILNRIADSCEPEKLSTLRKKILNGSSAMGGSRASGSGVFRESGDDEALLRFENRMISGEPSLSGAGNSVLPEAQVLRERLPDAEQLELFQLLKKENLRSGSAMMDLLGKINDWGNADFSGYKNGDGLGEVVQKMHYIPDAEEMFLSFIEYAPGYFDDWFEEAWDVLCRLGRAEMCSDTEEEVDFSYIWYQRRSGADDRTAKLECYLVKFLRIAITHGTREQVRQILSYLTPGVIVRHAGRLAAVDIPQLYSILKENGFSLFALHTVMASLKWENLNAAELLKIAPCMVDDQRFLMCFLEKKSNI
jgi:hypothetical protein